MYLDGVTFSHADLPPEVEALAALVVEAFVEVRTELGVGLTELVYVECLAEELRTRGIKVDREVHFPIRYKGRDVGRSTRVDMVVNDVILVEAKAVLELHPAHFAQFLTYLRLSGCPLGFLVNFHAVPFKEGICRRIRAGR